MFIITSFIYLLGGSFLGNGLLLCLPLQYGPRGIYYSEIGIGTPAQPFKVLVDTGSASFWVPSSLCEHGLWVANQKFNGSASSTYTSTDESFFDIYTDGSCVGGLVSIDTVTLSNTEIPAVTFGEAAVSQGAVKGSNVYDGILGLAQSATIEPFLSTIMDVMFDQGLVTEKVFTFLYPRFPGGSGEITFGGTDATKYDDLMYVAVSPGQYWDFAIARVQINGKRVGSNFQAVADTGTNHVLCPVANLGQISQLLGFKMSEAGVLPVDCSSLGNLPPIIFFLDGFGLEFSPTDYVEEVQLESGKKCYLNFSPSTSDQKKWIIGSSFLRQFYTVYDKGNSKIGFAIPK